MVDHLRVRNSDTAKRLPDRTENQSETDWRDPWTATEEARRTVPFLADLHKVSRRITDEINADPLEVQKLRKAREDAREGKASPRSDDTKSS